MAVTGTRALTLVRMERGGRRKGELREREIGF